MEGDSGYDISVVLVGGTTTKFKNAHYKNEPSWIRIFHGDASMERVSIIPVDSIESVTAERPMPAKRLVPRVPPRQFVPQGRRT